MAPINRACDYCGKSDKTVYEKYTVGTGTTVALMRNEFTGALVGKHTYQCADCYRSENNPTKHEFI